MSDQFSANMRGAYDLSSLRQPPANETTPQAQQPTAEIKVASLVTELTEVNLRHYLELSSKVVILVDFYSAEDAGSLALSQKLESLIASFGGRAILTRVDVVKHQRVAEAFSVTEPATFLAMMAGQPVPLFTGDIEIEKIQAVIEKILVVAVNNSITSVAVVDESVEPVATTPQLPPKHQSAVEALNAGEYQSAKDQYQQILNESPGDPIAGAGVAQAELLLRLQHVDVDKVLNNAPQNFDELMVAADALLAIGDYADAFEALLMNFAEAQQEQKNLMRERLLQFFEIVGKSTPEVVAARTRLTSMLF